MNRFIKKASILIIVPILPFILLELFIYSQGGKTFEEIALEQSYLKDADNYKWIELLDNDSVNILAGSSSVRYGLSCKELNSLSINNSIYANLAMDARDPIQTYFILKNLKLGSIRKIYFGLDPWIYAKRYYKHRNNYLYLDFNILECLQYFKEHDKSIFKKRYKAFFKFVFNSFQTKHKKNLIIPDNYGSFALNKTAVNFDNLSDWFQLEKYGWSNLQFEYLKKIESLCKKNKIEFYLFIPPKRSDYTQYYKNSYAELHKAYKTKIAENGIESPIFSKFDILDNQGDSTLFAEAFHLNKKGQIKFSKIFHNLSLKQMGKYSIDYNWFEKHKARTHNNVYSK